MERPSLGEQELAVLRFISERAPVPAREVVDKFAGEQDLARTTVLTKIERLRKKGYLARSRRQGVFYYSPRVPQAEVIQGLVREFVQKTLAGSVSPVVAYLANYGEFSEEDLVRLDQILDELRARNQSPGAVAGEETEGE
jgi:predicted transcriptional regulator